MNMKKTVLITGASSDIGSEIAIKFAKCGYNVVINYLTNEDRANELEINIHSFGGNCLVVKADVTKSEEVEKMITRTINKFGKIDVLVNNAGIAIDNDIYDKSKDEFLKVLEVNVVGTFLVSKEASHYMDNGTIINISSTDGIDTYNDISMDYCASKAGVISLTKTLAMRFPNLKVYSVAPNWVKTKTVLEMDPEYLEKELERINQKELITPSMVANKVWELCDNSNVISGSTIVIKDGKGN